MPAGPLTTGVVSAFGEHEGLGEITDSAGRIWPFHCVEIADGSRRIAVGTPVEFEPQTKLGRSEATRIRTTPA